jgi:hypothetical protein
MHQDMYDPKHRFFGLSGDTARKDKLFQKGLREPLLCEDCEQQFGRYEKYASGVFYGGREIGVQKVKNIIGLVGLDYTPLKLFFLSLLWRMGVTSLEYLKGIDLKEHESRLREMLVREQPGNALTYPCMLTAVMHEGKHMPDLIVPPGMALIDGDRVWTFAAAGFLFSYFVSDRLPPVAVHPTFLKPDGTMWIRLAEIREIAFLHEHCLQIAEAQRQRKAPSKPTTKAG